MAGKHFAVDVIRSVMNGNVFDGAERCWVGATGRVGV